MVQVRFHVQCECGVACCGKWGSNSFTTDYVTSLDCRHYSVKVWVDTNLGFFFGFNARVHYRFSITCKCGERWSTDHVYKAIGRGNYNGTTWSCPQCRKLIVVASQENNLLGLDGVIEEFVFNLFKAKLTRLIL